MNQRPASRGGIHRSYTNYNLIQNNVSKGIISKVSVVAIREDLRRVYHLNPLSGFSRKILAGLMDIERYHSPVCDYQRLARSSDVGEAKVQISGNLELFQNPSLGSTSSS